MSHEGLWGVVVRPSVSRAVIAAILAAAQFGPAAAAAQSAPGFGSEPLSLEPVRRPAKIQSAAEALAQDAGEYARQNGVGLAEAMRRLRAQEESVAATDRLQEIYRDRIAGISIEHYPDYRIVVLLTGSDPVPDQVIFAGGMNVPIVFRTGAAATRE